MKYFLLLLVLASFSLQAITTYTPKKTKKNSVFVTDGNGNNFLYYCDKVYYLPYVIPMEDHFSHPTLVPEILPIPVNEPTE
jgi:hypothetical protein